VLIDQEVHFEGTGAQAKRVLTAPTPERLKVIHDLAAAAVGLNTERGDQIIVESLPFESTVNLEPPGAGAPATQTPALSPIEQLKKNPKMLIGVAVGAAVVLAGLFFLIFKMLKKSPAPAQVRQTESLPPSPESATPRVPGGDSWAPSQLGVGAMPALAPARIEVLTNQIRETAQKDGEVCAGVLRGWLREEQA